MKINYTMGQEKKKKKLKIFNTVSQKLTLKLNCPFVALY